MEVEEKVVADLSRSSSCQSLPGSPRLMTAPPPSLTPLTPELLKTPENIAGPVYPKLVSWLIEPANRKVGSWAKFFSASNEVRQLLFDRNRKAQEKYGDGLKFEEGPNGLAEAALKVGDAVFFLYKFLIKKGTTKPEKRSEWVDQDKKLKQVEELIILLQNLAADIRKTTPTSSC